MALTARLHKSVLVPEIVLLTVRSVLDICQTCCFGKTTVSKIQVSEIKNNRRDPPHLSRVA